MLRKQWQGSPLEVRVCLRDPACLRPVLHQEELPGSDMPRGPSVTSTHGSWDGGGTRGGTLSGPQEVTRNKPVCNQSH